jgi:hypothetical protein
MKPSDETSGLLLSDQDQETNAFALSRIYGQGWTVAKRMLASGNDVGAMDASAQNPHQGQEERSRWESGFTDAIESLDHRITVTGRKSWRRINKT